jgi:hypothetical protein
MPAGVPLTGPGYQLTELRSIDSISLPLAAGQKVQINSVICWDTSQAGVVVKATGTSTTLQPIGRAQSAVDNSAGTGTVMVPVRLGREHWINWLDNDTGSNAITLANIGTNQYLLDDHTVTTSASADSHSGVVWGLRDNGTTVGVEFPF